MRLVTRYLLAVTLFTSTLCADRVQTAAPRAEAVPVRGLVDRLTDGLRRSVSTRPLVRQRCPSVTVALAAPPVQPVRPVTPVATPVSPACLPMPPPLA